MRTLISDEYQLNVTSSGENPLRYGCEGGQLLATNDSDFSDLVISRKLYEEHGRSICKKKFDV